MTTKLKTLEKILAQMNSVIVAFSGGVDSTFLAKVVQDVLGPNAIAVTGDSPSLARSELEETKKLAKQIGIKHLVINTNEMKDKNYTANPINRCYFCKHELYSKLTTLTKELGIKTIINGMNYDDLSEYRAGTQAAQEFSVQSPLVEAMLTKKEIREYSQQLGLPTFDKPAMPCLSSRIPHGSAVTAEKLKQIEEAERHIRNNYAVQDLRVRHFGDTAIIEADTKTLAIMKKDKERISEYFKIIGFNTTQTRDYKRGRILPIIPQ